MTLKLYARPDREWWDSNVGGKRVKVSIRVIFAFKKIIFDYSKNSGNVEDKLSEWRFKRRNRSKSPLNLHSIKNEFKKENPGKPKCANIEMADEGIFSNDSSSNTSSANNSGVVVVDVGAIINTGNA